jgi:hypothetical protein
MDLKKFSKYFLRTYFFNGQYSVALILAYLFGLKHTL